MDMTVDQRREDLQRQLAELEQKAAEEAAVRAVREAEANQRRQAAIEAHDAAEKANSTGLTQMGKELAAARKQLGEATTKAVQQLLALWDAAATYDAQLRQHAESLHAADLAARYRDDEHNVLERFDTGAFPIERSAFSEDPWLVLRGQRWERIHPRNVVDYATRAALAGRMPIGSQHGRSVVGELLDDIVKRPAEVRAPEQPRIDRSAWEAM